MRSGNMSRFYVLWNQSLKRRPLATNVATYACFYTAAEVSQQIFNRFFTSEKPAINLKQASRVVITGSTLYPGTLFVWYKYLDKKYPGKSLKNVLTKVFADQFIMTPILLLTFFAVLSHWEGVSIFQELKAKYWKAFIYNQTFWIPGQLVNFALIQPHLRVAYVSALSFLWINVLCFIKREKVTE